MAPLHLSLFLFGASLVSSSPARVARQETVTVTATVSASAPGSTAWDAGAVHDYPIHSSCNATQATQIKRGLSEAVVLATHARDHILRWSNTSEIYQKYFGNASTGEPIGWFEKIANGDKGGILFRCDNPDDNCDQEGWAGHWRGSNATSETVICDLFYETRKLLDGMCGFGYDVANGPTNFFWASDLLHRLLHIPKVGEGIVEHYAGEYDTVIELAETNPEEAVRNSDTLQYFALEAYAYDIAVPGEGCAGKFSPTSSEVVASATAAPSTTATEASSATSDAPKECHTHSDGVVHCS